MRGMQYNAPIDGLRAIAVLAVVAYHAGLPIPGGFVGVDIFFVISGYLITRLLHEELQRTARISFLDFYARRARRILPALVAVTAVTLAASIALLSQADVASTSNAAGAALLFAANIFFANAPSGYFDPALQDNPLLHLWSLGVEEQFYLVWPVVLVLARRKPTRALAIIAIASFVVCEWMLAHGQEQAAFYLAPARAWELAAGGLVALSSIRLPRSTVWVGLALVVVALALPFDHFPGRGALPAVLGACALIAAFRAGHGCRPLETRPMLWIGLRSYSLYLWHWPVMVLGEALPTWLQLLAACTLAAISYRFIESPFRRRWVAPAGRSVAAASLIVAAGAASAFSLQPLQLGRGSFPPANVPSPYAQHCDDWYKSATVKPCVFGSRTAPHKAVIIGDSVALQWFPAVYKIFDRPDWQLIVLTKSACPMVAASYYYERIGRVYEECDRWRTDALEAAARLHPDVIIVGSSNTYNFSDRQWLEGTRVVIERLAQGDAEVRLLRSTPAFTPRAFNTYPRVANLQRQAVAHMEQVRIVDMTGTICSSGVCRRSTRQGNIFRDDQHLSWDYAASLAPELARQLAIRDLM